MLLDNAFREKTRRLCIVKPPYSFVLTTARKHVLLANNERT